MRLRPPGDLPWANAAILYVVVFLLAAAIPVGWQLVRTPVDATGPAETVRPVSPIPVSSTPSQDCGDKGDLVVAAGEDISTGGVRRELLDDWNRGLRPSGHPKAVLLELSGSTDVARAQMAAPAQVGSCRYDILLLDVAWMAEFARHGYIRPIGPRHPERFVDGLLRAAEIDGEQYGVPFAADAPLEFHRRDAGQGGYLLQLTDQEAGTINFLESVELGGEQVLHGPDRTDVRLDGDTVRALTSATRTSFTNGATVPVLRESLDLTEDLAVEAFKAGAIDGRQVAYMRNWPIAFHRMAAEPRMRYPDGSLRFEVRAITGGVLGGSVLAISRFIPQHKLEPAVRLIEHLTGVEAQTRLFACGGYGPVLRQVYDNYRAGHGEACPHDGGTEAVAASRAELADLAGELRRAVESARTRPKSPYYAQFSEAFRRCARRAFQAPDVEPETFLPAQDVLRSALEGRVPDGSPPC